MNSKRYAHYQKGLAGFTVILGLLAAGVVWTVTYHGQIALGEAFMNDADIVYPEQVYLELFLRGRHLSDWYLSPAPYFIDLLVYFLVRPLATNAFWGIFLFTFAQVVGTVALAASLAYYSTRSLQAVLMSETACLLGLCLATNKLQPYIYIYFPVFHVGNLLVGSVVLALAARMVVGEQPRLVHQYFAITCLTVVGIASDLFMLVTFILPICCTLAVSLLSGRKLFEFRDHRWCLILLLAIGSVGGVILARLITVRTSPGLLSLPTDQIVRSLLHLPATLVRILGVAPVPNSLVVLFFGFLLGKCVVWVRKPSRGEFPFWEFTLTFSFWGLLLFLGLHNLLSFSELSTTRYLLTIAWLPLIFPWVPFHGVLKRSSLMWLVGPVVLSLAMLGWSLQGSFFLRDSYRAKWVEELDRHIEELEAETGRPIICGVSTYWQAKSTMTQSEQGLLIAQYNAQLRPFLWITSKRWYRKDYDFALVAYTDEDQVFFENLIERCGEPVLVKDCGGAMRLVVFPEGALSLPCQPL